MSVGHIARDGAAPQIDEVLRGLDLLQGVDETIVRQLIDRCPRQSVAAGEVVIAAGAINRRMYLVLSGRLEVLLDAKRGDVIAELAPGETTGEISQIDQLPASATVRAITASELLLIDLPTFWSLVGASHAFAVNLILKLAERVRGGNRAMNEIARLRAQFEKAALHDALTGVPNRRWLDQTLPRLLERHAESGEPLALAMIDIDHFKRFNDDHGHAAGDRVLTAVARCLVNRMRPTDLLARFGGEEFVAIFANTDEEGSTVATERLLASIASLRVDDAEGRSLPAVTISIGVAMAKPDHDAEALVSEADAALYRAKDSGRNRVCR